MTVIRKMCRVPWLSLTGILLASSALTSCVGRLGNQTAGTEFSRLYSQDDPRTIAVGADPRTLDLQLQRARSKQTQLEAGLGAADDEDEQEKIEERLELVDFALDWLVRTRKEGADAKDTLAANLLTERILNAVDASEPGHENDSVTKNFASTMLFGHSIPALSEKQRSVALGDRRAHEEADFLFDPANDAFFTPGDLSSMTPDEVSLLDVSYDHPGWHRQDEQDRLRRGRIRNFESWMEAGIRSVLRNQADSVGASGWDIHSSRRVLVMDEVYKSATSPKAKTKDAFGVEWKIKWGDEVQAETVSSRLYLLAGGKMTDLVFAGDPGADGLVLVLSEEGEYEEEAAEEGAEREPETVQHLVDTLDDFYGFDLTPYIQDQGVITADNVDAVLRNLPRGGKSKYSRQKLIGRQWVSFREYLLELRPDGFVRREDGSKMSDFAANNDRVARGLYLMSLWMSNRDVKDDNNKAFYLRSPDSGSSGKIIDYREGHHDMGVTLGKIGSSAEINAMQTGADFMKKGWLGRSFKFRQIYIYKPEAWERATWADCRWMARKIADLSVGEIREAVAASKWPDFMQEALVFKLLDRRNRIAEMYDLVDRLDQRVAVAPSIAVGLGNPAEIEQAERKYGLRRGSLAAELDQIGAGSGYVETLVYQGQVADSRGSALIRLLVRQRHPAGLDDRYRRMTDSPPRPLR